MFLLLCPATNCLEIDFVGLKLNIDSELSMVRGGLKFLYDYLLRKALA